MAGNWGAGQHECSSKRTARTDKWFEVLLAQGSSRSIFRMTALVLAPVAYRFLSTATDVKRSLSTAASLKLCDRSTSSRSISVLSAWRARCRRTLTAFGVTDSERAASSVSSSSMSRSTRTERYFSGSRSIQRRTISRESRFSRTASAPLPHVTCESIHSPCRSKRGSKVSIGCSPRRLLDRNCRRAAFTTIR